MCLNAYYRGAELPVGVHKGYKVFRLNIDGTYSGIYYGKERIKLGEWAESEGITSYDRVTAQRYMPDGYEQVIYDDTYSAYPYGFHVFEGMDLDRLRMYMRFEAKTPGETYRICEVEYDNIVAMGDHIVTVLLNGRMDRAVCHIAKKIRIVRDLTGEPAVV